MSRQQKKQAKFKKISNKQPNKPPNKPTNKPPNKQNKPETSNFNALYRNDVDNNDVDNKSNQKKKPNKDKCKVDKNGLNIDRLVAIVRTNQVKLMFLHGQIYEFSLCLFFDRKII